MCRQTLDSRGLWRWEQRPFPRLEVSHPEATVRCPSPEGHRPPLSAGSVQNGTPSNIASSQKSARTGPGGRLSASRRLSTTSERRRPPPDCESGPASSDRNTRPASKSYRPTWTLSVFPEPKPPRHGTTPCSRRKCEVIFARVLRTGASSRCASTPTATSTPSLAEAAPRVVPALTSVRSEERRPPKHRLLVVTEIRVRVAGVPVPHKCRMVTGRLPLFAARRCGSPNVWPNS